MMHFTPPRAGFLLNQCYNCRISTYPMSEKQLKAFIAKVQADTSLQEQLKAEGADVEAIAKAAGFLITTDDLNTYRQNLSEKELEGLAGAGFTSQGGLPCLTMQGLGCMTDFACSLTSPVCG